MSYGVPYIGATPSIALDIPQDNKIQIATGEDLTADRILSLQIGDVARTWAMPGMDLLGATTTGEVPVYNSATLSFEPGGPFADLAHTHPLSEIEQSGASDGQVAVWRDSPGEWVPENQSGGGGGATTFLGLTDTPSSYSGNAIAILQVNSGQTALEFTRKPVFNNTVTIETQQPLLPQLIIDTHSDSNSFAGAVNMRRERGTIASPADTVSGDMLFQLVGQGKLSGSFKTAVSIYGFQSGAAGSNLPGKISFATGDGTVSVPTIRTEIDSTGLLSTYNGVTVTGPGTFLNTLAVFGTSTFLNDSTYVGSKKIIFSVTGTYIHAPAPNDLTIALTGDLRITNQTPNGVLRSATTVITSDATITHLGDVDTVTTAPIEGDVLTWDDGSSMWVPGAAAGGGKFGVPVEDTTPLVFDVEDPTKFIRLRVDSAQTTATTIDLTMSPYAQDLENPRFVTVKIGNGTANDPTFTEDTDRLRLNVQGIANAYEFTASEFTGTGIDLGGGISDRWDTLFLLNEIYIGASGSSYPRIEEQNTNLIFHILPTASLQFRLSSSTTTPGAGYQTPAVHVIHNANSGVFPALIMDGHASGVAKMIWTHNGAADGDALHMVFDYAAVDFSLAFDNGATDRFVVRGSDGQVTVSNLATGGDPLPVAADTDGNLILSTGASAIAFTVFTDEDTPTPTSFTPADDTTVRFEAAGSGLFVSALPGAGPGGENIIRYSRTAAPTWLTDTDGGGFQAEEQTAADGLDVTFLAGNTTWGPGVGGNAILGAGTGPAGNGVIEVQLGGATVFEFNLSISNIVIMEAIADTAIRLLPGESPDGSVPGAFANFNRGTNTGGGGFTFNAGTGSGGIEANVGGGGFILTGGASKGTGLAGGFAFTAGAASGTGDGGGYAFTGGASAGGTPGNFRVAMNGGVIQLQNNIIIGAGAAGIDYTITVDGETNDGAYIWREDEDYWEFADDVFIPGTEALYFRSTSNYIDSPNAGELRLVSATILIGPGTTADPVMTFAGSTTSGTFTYDESAGRLSWNQAIRVTGTKAIEVGNGTAFMQDLTGVGTWYLQGSGMIMLITGSGAFGGNTASVFGTVASGSTTTYQSGATALHTWKTSTTTRMTLDHESLNLAGWSADPGTIAAGDLWYNTTSGSYRFGTSLGRNGAVGLIHANTADSSAIANTTSETNFDVTKSLAANGLKVGKCLRVVAVGKYSNTVSPTLRLRVKFGTTVLLDTGAVLTAASVTDQPWRIEALIVCRSTGASGTVMANGRFDNGRSLAPLGNAAAVTVDTTSAQTCQVSAQWGTASASNTITLQTMTIEELD